MSNLIDTFKSQYNKEMAGVSGTDISSQRKLFQPTEITETEKLTPNSYLRDGVTLSDIFTLVKNKKLSRNKIKDGIRKLLNNPDELNDFLSSFKKEDKTETKEATGSGGGVGAYEAPLFSDMKTNESIEEISEGENEPTNPQLWSRAKSMAKSKFKVYPSAYANGWAAKWYKSKGGGWRKKSKNESEESDEVIHEDLRRWFKEKWVDVSKKVDGKHPPCGREDAEGKSYPKCRPTKKVSKETPKLASSYDKDEKKAMTQQKRRAEKKDPKVGKGNKPTFTRFDENESSEITKIETKEATGSASSGSYETPKMWAKSTNKKDWRGKSKTQIPGGKFVQVKEKCKKFPYCNQGDINALNIFENKTVKETITRVSEKYGVHEDHIRDIISNQIEKLKNKDIY